MNNISFPGLGIDLSINNIAFSLGNIKIHWYAIIIMLGAVLGILLCEKEAKRLGEKGDTIYDMVIWGFIPTVVGARLYYVLFSLSEFKQDPLSVFYIWEGGIAIYGGVIAALITGIIYCRKKGLNTLKMLDIVIIGFLVGQIIGRWGNFINGEVYGVETSLPWRMSVNGSVPSHPLFIYESLWNLAILCYIWFTRKSKGFNGRTLTLYMIFYGAGRFWMEGLRQTNFILKLGNMAISQLVSIVIIIAGILLYLSFRKKHKEEMEELPE